jgi:hypothetical protein
MSLPKPPATEELLATLNQPLPHSPDAEEGVLACLMNDPETYMPESITKLKADAFHSDTFREIFHTMQDLFICESPVTPVTVADRLRQAGNLDKVGGASRISELYTTTPASASIWAYCLEQMLDHWTTRRLIRRSAQRRHSRPGRLIGHDRRTPGCGAADPITRAVQRNFIPSRVNKADHIDRD